VTQIVLRDEGLIEPIAVGKRALATLRLDF